METIRVSHSKISSWTQCSAKYDYHYVKKVETPEPAAFAVGSTVHKVIEEVNHLGGKVSEDVLRGLTKDALGKFAVGVVTEEVDPQQIWGMVKAWHDSPRTLPKQMEVMATAALKNPLTGELVDGVEVEAVFDGIVEEKDAYMEFVEYKTSAQSWNAARVAMETQGDFYTLVSGKPDVKLNYEIITKTRVPKVQRFSVTKTAQDAHEAFKKVTSYLAWLRNGTVTKCQGTHCSWCEYREICLGMQRRLASVQEVQ